MPLNSSRRIPGLERSRRLAPTSSVVDDVFAREATRRRRATEPTEGWMGDAWNATKKAANATKDAAKAAAEMAADAAEATVDGAKAAAAKTKEMVAGSSSDEEEDDDEVAAA